jgi:peptide/nickel transport system permease protein
MSCMRHRPPSADPVRPDDPTRRLPPRPASGAAKIDDLAASTPPPVSSTTRARRRQPGRLPDRERVASAAPRPVFLARAVITILFLWSRSSPTSWHRTIRPGRSPHCIDQVRRQTNPVPGPEPGFPLGADDRGRDLLSRLIVGSQQTLLVGVFATIFSLIGGLILGTLAGAFGGWVDSLVMRASTSCSRSRRCCWPSRSRPGGAAEPVDGHHRHRRAYLPVFARLLRGSMLAQRSSDHVLAARALGVKRAAIVFRHMLPNSWDRSSSRRPWCWPRRSSTPPRCPSSASATPTTASPSGARCSGGAEVHRTIPHLAFYPAACIIVVAFGFTLMGESLREALDPKSRR